MTILFIGDIVGRAGRVAVKKVLPGLKKKFKVDFVIANGENLAGGFGMTEETYKEMIGTGIDYFTSGNHIWKKSDFLPFLSDKKINVLRPANYGQDAPGRGVADLKPKGLDLMIINLQGLVFMDEYIKNPFRLADQLINASTRQLVTIVDFHAEATSEKVSLGHYLDGRVSAVIGTHTHIQTNDARILPKGTAYLTDVGMVGALNSSLGDDLEPAIKHFLTGLPFKGNPAKGDAIFNACLIKIDMATGKAKNIDLINKIVEL